MFGAPGTPRRLQDRVELKLQATTQPCRKTTAPNAKAKVSNRTVVVPRRPGQRHGKNSSPGGRTLPRQSDAVNTVRTPV